MFPAAPAGTALHARHEEAGAEWEPVGQWRAALTGFPKPGEDQARRGDTRERITATSVLLVGLLDASDAGWQDPQFEGGPDAGRFMDTCLLHQHDEHRLKTWARCRYGLMCSENGFLMDDGVGSRGLR